MQLYMLAIHPMLHIQMNMTIQMKEFYWYWSIKIAINCCLLDNCTGTLVQHRLLQRNSKLCLQLAMRKQLPDQHTPSQWSRIIKIHRFQQFHQFQHIRDQIALDSSSNVSLQKGSLPWQTRLYPFFWTHLCSLNKWESISNDFITSRIIINTSKCCSSQEA